MLGDALKWDIIPVVTPTIVGGLDWGTMTVSRYLDNLKKTLERYLQGNDTWSGVLGYLQNGTSDAAALMYQKTDLRNEFFDYSYPVNNVRCIFY